MEHTIPNQHSALVKILSWLLSSISACFVIVRFATKLSITKRWTTDDTMIIFALAFSIAQTIILTIAVSYGYGDQSETTSNNPQVLTQEKFVYFSNILFFFSMCFGMLSTNQLVMDLSPQKSYRTISWIISASTIVWTITAVFGFAFQCRLPFLWDFENKQCSDSTAFYTFVTCANLFIEFTLILQPAFIIWKLQLVRSRKLIIIACFCSRFFVAVALIGLIAVVWQSNSTGGTVLSYGVTILTTLVDNFSIVAASIPYLRPFLQGLEHGMTVVRMATYDTSVEDSQHSENNLVSRWRYLKSTSGKSLPQAIQGSRGFKSEGFKVSSKQSEFLAQPTILSFQQNSAHERLNSSEGGIMQTCEYTVVSDPA